MGWVTLKNGVHVFVNNGEDIDEAFERAKRFKRLNPSQFNSTDEYTQRLIEQEEEMESYVESKKQNAVSVTSQELYKKLQSMEDDMLDFKSEHGLIIDPNSGAVIHGETTDNAKTIEISDNLLRATKNMIFTHNHPIPTALSPGDIRQAGRLNQMRAVGKLKTGEKIAHILTRQSTNPVNNATVRKFAEEYLAQVKSGGSATEWLYTNAPKYGFAYSVEIANKSVDPRKLKRLMDYRGGHVYGMK